MPGFDLQLTSGDVATSYANPAESEISDWELMLGEIHHRMKNTLAILGASVRCQFGRGVTADLLAASVDSLERRIVAFGTLYRLLSGDSNCQSIVADEFFADICRALSASILEPANIRCEVSIEHGTLSFQQSHRLALIVTELVTNAAKHAFPKGKEGVISIKMGFCGRFWCCSVSDNGSGAGGAVPGTGRKILAALCNSIHADFRIDANECGTTAKIVFIHPDR